MSQPTPLDINTPEKLVQEFKKSGNLDILRRDILRSFRATDQSSALLTRVEEIAREKLANDDRLKRKTKAQVHAELIQEIDRFPIVERAVAEFPFLSSSELSKSIDDALNQVLEDGRTGNRRQTVRMALQTTHDAPLSSPSASQAGSPSKPTPQSTPFHITESLESTMPEAGQPADSTHQPSFDKDGLEIDTPSVIMADVSEVVGISQVKEMDTASELENPVASVPSRNALEDLSPLSSPEPV